MRTALLICSMFITFSASAQVVQFDISSEMNFDAIGSQAEINEAYSQAPDSDSDGVPDDNYRLYEMFSAAGSGEWYKGEDHQFANQYSKYCFYTDPDDLNQDSETGLGSSVTTDYATYTLRAADTSANLASLTSTANAVRLGTQRGQSTSDGAEATVTITLPAGQQDRYSSINLLMTGTDFGDDATIDGESFPRKHAWVDVYANYSDSTSSLVWTSPRAGVFDGTTNYDPYAESWQNDIAGGIPSAFGFTDSASVFESAYISTFDQVQVADVYCGYLGSPYASLARSGNMYMYDVDGGISVDDTKTLTGLTITVSNGPNLWVTGYPEGDSVNIYAIAGVQAASHYYVDPDDGSDTTGDGSRNDPWATIGKALDYVEAGDYVNLMPGSYGYVSIDIDDYDAGSSWDLPLTIRHDPQSTAYTATIEKLYMVGDSLNYYIIFEDLDFYATGGTSLIDFYGIRQAKIIDCKLHGPWGGAAMSTAAFTPRSCQYIIVEDCEIYNSGHRAIYADSGTVGLTVRGCDIHDIAGSGIYISTNSTDTLIEYNHIQDQHPTWRTGVHGSGISVRSGDVVIRGNIVHDYGNTRLIRLYPNDADDDGYSDVLVENNVCYDGLNDYVEFLDVGDDVVIRNNTFTQCNINFAPNADGSGLSIYNNICTDMLILNNDYDLGSAYLNAQTRAQATALWGNVSQGHNIFHALTASGEGFRVYCSAFPGTDTNIVLKDDDGDYKTGYDSTYFDVGEFFATGGTSTTPFMLELDSDAVDFADSGNSPAIDVSGAARDTYPDAGAWEYLP